MGRQSIGSMEVHGVTKSQIGLSDSTAATTADIQLTQRAGTREDSCHGSHKEIREEIGIKPGLVYLSSQFTELTGVRIEG